MPVAAALLAVAVALVLSVVVTLRLLMLPMFLMLESACASVETEPLILPQAEMSACSVATWFCNSVTGACRRVSTVVISEDICDEPRALTLVMIYLLS